ncbi:MAG: hypothetical protein OXF08_09850 [Bacteroidetes bacterium]|nr:hypothetical protein [Bacteroidota bacterium]
MPSNSERTISILLADSLRGTLPNWEVGAEQTNVFTEKMKQPDIVVSHVGGLTVIIETEFSPASNVESDTTERLGQTLLHTGQHVEQCIAVKLPISLRTVEQKDLEASIKTARYFYAVFTFDGKDELYDHSERWPIRGWLEGGLDDLANCIETVALSERRVANGVKILEMGVSQAAGYLQFHAPEYILLDLAENLHQQPGEQTTRMAMAILANAVIFHMRLARLHSEVPPLERCKGELGGFIKSNVIDCWKTILNINYWPIFSLASDLLSLLPELDAQKVIKLLNTMACELRDYGVADIQDLSGRMFQQLITDRKFLATFYTLPASATLLAELAVSRLDVYWSAPNNITSLKVADLACGTGALLGAVYHAFSSRHRRSGGDDSLLHSHMMENVLTAADIMPSAVHLTAATLSGMHPNQPYGHTRIINMPYGEGQDGNGASIGSLDLMEADQTRAIFGTGRKALAGQEEALKDDTPGGAVVEVPHGSMDLVIMNPPFTRPTNHEASAVPIPSFAGFQTKEDEQLKMATRLKEIRNSLTDPAGHGNAGLASNFIDLAHIKLRHGGVLALVLPATFMQGKSWENARLLLRKYYENIVVVGLATDGNTDRAFSADTGMAEVLVVATRKNDKCANGNEILVANLFDRPATQLEALITSQMIEHHRSQQRQETGTILLTKTHRIGTFFRTDDWSTIGIREASLVIFMKALESGHLMLPRMGNPENIPICKLKKLGRRGVLDRDINGRTSEGVVRGPFDLEPQLETSEYPILWSHDVRRETRLIVESDCQGIIRKGYRQQAAELWSKGASRLHFNRDFGLNSQRVAACLTEIKTLGGRSWPNFLTNQQWEIPLALWANTTPGLISYWWIGTRQQQGRCIVTITRLTQLLSIDVRSLTEDQFALSQEIIDDFKDKEFLPANEAYRDDVRIALDKAVLVTLLGIQEDLLENLAILRKQWCNEPSVHGGKHTKP